MDTTVLLLNFGEPERPDREAVIEYLTAIFYQNADIEGTATEEEKRERARQLANRRAPALLEEYESIGGSPLNKQSREQAASLEDELAKRGYAVDTCDAYQFVEPTIETRLAELADGTVDHLVALPVYPLCGPSTTVAALDRVDTWLATNQDWNPQVDHLSGWHHSPRYLRLRTEAIQRLVASENLDLDSDGTTLLFSAHGTPISYLEAGSRYRIYVDEYCETIARMLGVEAYELGFQNHENRDVQWTSPDIEELIQTMAADHLIVDPVSFLHEQSETLVELDDEFSTAAAEQGMSVHRVPIPHADTRVPEIFADLLEPFLAGFSPEMAQLRPCQCHQSDHTYCLNAPR